MIDPLSSGAITFHLILAGLLTLVVGWAILILYRRAVRRWMGAPAGIAHPIPASTTASSPDHAAPDGKPEFRLDLRTASDPAFADAVRSPTFRGASAAFRRAAVVYAAAGFAHAATATALQILLGQFDFVPLRATVVFWAYAWPVALTLGLFWGGDRRLQRLTVIGYFSVLALLALIVELVPTWPLATIPAFLQPLLLWALFALQSVYLLLFLNRRVRAIGPVMLLFMMITVAGSRNAGYAA